MRNQSQNFVIHHFKINVCTLLSLLKYFRSNILINLKTQLLLCNCYYMGREKIGVYRSMFEQCGGIDLSL
jgi:hypothetical protein